MRGIYLVKLSMYAGYLLLLAGDVSLNPGPSTGNRNGQMCPACSKAIRQNQSRLWCRLCEANCHLKCVGVDFSLNNLCQACNVQRDTGEENDNVTGSYNYLPSRLMNITKMRGFKIIHQNIHSLSNKVDQLRLFMHELKSGIHLLALTETWAGSGMHDSEFEILGYKLFRGDRGAASGGIAV